MPAPSLITAPVTAADEQWFYSPRELLHTPTIKAGFSPKVEGHLRALAIKRLLCLKDAMNPPQLVIAAAATYLHRFYMRESFQDWPWQIMAASAFFLASKVEEQARRLKDVVSATLELDADREPNRPRDRRHLPVDEASEVFTKTRQRILFFEEALLRVLCFDLTIRQPYTDMVKGVGLMWRNENTVVATKVKRAAWPFITDSLPTTVSLIHRSIVIAAASVVLACTQLEIPLPERPKPIPAELLELAREEGEEREEELYWQDVFGVKVEDVRDAMARMTAVYTTAEDPYVKEEAARTSKDALAALPTETKPPTAVTTVLPNSEDVQMPDASPIPQRNVAPSSFPINTQPPVKKESATPAPAPTKPTPPPLRIPSESDTKHEVSTLQEEPKEPLSSEDPPYAFKFGKNAAILHDVEGEDSDMAITPS
ncbi:hypothetical protein P7C70_g8529, partial [Phenoliferia sp. Uapishka_3]